MKPTESAALLTVAAAFDNRKPDADQAKAWALALDGFDFTACRDAIVAHYRTTNDWLMPSHVITLVRRQRAKRISEDAALNPPPGLDPDDTEAYARWLTRARADAAAGMPAPTVTPSAIRGRDVLGQLGTVGHDPDAAGIAREAIAQARANKADAEAMVRDAREAAVAERAAARDADRLAREAASERGAA